MIAWVLALALGADDTLPRIQQALAHPAAIEGAFSQAKQVKGFKRPLVSSGTFLVKKDEGVRWVTTAPFASELQVRAKEIVSSQGGKVVFALDGEKEPGVKVITQLLFAFLSGDLKTLEAHFDVKAAKAEAEGWSLALEPKAPALAKVLSRVELAGGEHVRAVTLFEANGDLTKLTLTDTRSVP